MTWNYSLLLFMSFCAQLYTLKLAQKSTCRIFSDTCPRFKFYFQELQLIPSLKNQQEMDHTLIGTLREEVANKTTLLAVARKRNVDLRDKVKVNGEQMY